MLGIKWALNIGLILQILRIINITICSLFWGEGWILIKKSIKYNCKYHPHKKKKKKTAHIIIPNFYLVYIWSGIRRNPGAWKYTWKNSQAIQVAFAVVIFN